MSVRLQCFDKVKKYFDDDMDKAWKWFYTANPGLGYASPMEMLRNGRAKKLLKFIESRLEGNHL